MMDTEPGKYASQTGKWYLSCDTGDSILLGTKEKGSIGGILNVVEHIVTEEQSTALYDLTKGDVVEDGLTGESSIIVVQRQEFFKILGINRDDNDWVPKDGKVALIVEYLKVYELSLAFE